MDRKPIDDPAFWGSRLGWAMKLGERHRAVYNCTLDLWLEAEAHHRQVLARHVRPTDSVLDLGCGWGRVRDLLPPHHRYVGVDLSPEFVSLGRMERPGIDLRCGTFESVLPGFDLWEFDWGVLVSVRGMIVREQGSAEWHRLLPLMLRVCRRLLVLEYTPGEPEEVLP